MDRLVIDGGRPLAGEVRISGAKNAALPILCSALLTADPLVLTNVPRLNDVRTMQTLLAQMGVKIDAGTSEKVALDAGRIDWPLAPYELVKTMRASILALGPLVARCGEARVSLPGRLRDRAAPRRSARQGPRRDGRRDRPGARLHQCARASPQGSALRLRCRHGHRHREPDDGGNARRRHDGPRERRARAGSRRPRALPRGDGREHRGGRHRPHHDRRGRRACTAPLMRSCRTASRRERFSRRWRRRAAMQRSPGQAAARWTRCWTNCARRAPRSPSPTTPSASRGRVRSARSTFAPRRIRRFPPTCRRR